MPTNPTPYLDDDLDVIAGLLVTGVIPTWDLAYYLSMATGIAETDERLQEIQERFVSAKDAIGGEWIDCDGPA